MESSGDMVVSMDSAKPVPAPFLTKTYQLVDDPCTDPIVSWGGDEGTFVVWRPPEFARDLLPNYFKHSNFSSFVRQLNTYGFRKIAADRWEFANEYFRRGEKHLLSEIHRRKTSQVPQFFHCHPPHAWIEPPSAVPGGDVDFLSALSEDNQRLRKKNSLLLSELTRMKKLYNDIIYFIQHHVAPPVAPEPRHARLVELPPCDQNQPLPATAEPDSGVKLFGFPIHGKKRLDRETICLAESNPEEQKPLEKSLEREGSVQDVRES
ncbi:unnamed protein product [Musa banksii]